MSNVKSGTLISHRAEYKNTFPRQDAKWKEEEEFLNNNEDIAVTKLQGAHTYIGKEYEGG